MKKILLVLALSVTSVIMPSQPRQTVVRCKAIVNANDNLVVTVNLPPHQSLLPIESESQNSTSTKVILGCTVLAVVSLYAGFLEASMINGFWEMPSAKNIASAAVIGAAFGGLA